MMGEAADIVFARVDEPNATLNLRRLRELSPLGSNLIEVCNVKGFDNVLMAARDSLKRDHFFLVDADAYVLDTFPFSIPSESYTHTCCIFKALNPVNDLVYGHGGVKVYDRRSIFSFLSENRRSGLISDSLEVLNLLDFPCGGSRAFLNTVANIHQFNTSEQMTWRAAYRESAKLRFLTKLSTFGASLPDIERWLRGWTSIGNGRAFGEASMQGAQQGSSFGWEATNEEILLVNDYGYLAGKFEARSGVACEASIPAGGNV